MISLIIDKLFTEKSQKRMFNFSKKKSDKQSGISWNVLDAAPSLEEIKAESAQQPVMIFKHSTRCAISSTVLNRLERSWNSDEVAIKPYFLDLINYRDLSNQVAQEFGIMHESPQVLVIKDGKAVYHSSHFGISYDELKEIK